MLGRLNAGPAKIAKQKLTAKRLGESKTSGSGLAERLSLAPDGAGRCSEDNNQNGDACCALLCDTELDVRERE